MITPKEKAEELVNKFRLSAVFTDSYVKAIAKTAVDEILELSTFESIDTTYEVSRFIIKFPTDEINDLFYETIYYTQTIHNSNELCIICQLDETEDGKQWDRYKIVCGHIFHTRCFRKWAGKKMCINCPYCGDIPMIDKHEYCSSCKIFGHHSVSCLPKINDSFKYDYFLDYVILLF